VQAVVVVESHAAGGSMLTVADQPVAPRGFGAGPSCRRCPGRPGRLSPLARHDRLPGRHGPSEQPSFWPPARWAGGRPERTSRRAVVDGPDIRASHPPQRWRRRGRRPRPRCRSRSRCRRLQYGRRPG
jgi:hypothetical protein